MATVPSPEESGRRILAIFACDNLRAGEMMRWPALHSNFLNGGGRADDFEAGLRWLIRQRYAEVRTERWPPQEVFLTKAGFDAA